jgi:hypothetical protein
MTTFLVIETLNFRILPDAWVDSRGIPACASSSRGVPIHSALSASMLRVVRSAPLYSVMRDTTLRTVNRGTSATCAHRGSTLADQSRQVSSRETMACARLDHRSVPLHIVPSHLVLAFAATLWKKKIIKFSLVQI